MIEDWYVYDVDNDRYQSYSFFHCISVEEYRRFQETQKFPIVALYFGGCYWFDEYGQLHNLKGPAYTQNIGTDKEIKQYYVHGIRISKKEWESKVPKKIIFSAQKIKMIKKLLYIPELFQNVYYDNKRLFISLLQKI